MRVWALAQGLGFTECIPNNLLFRFRFRGLALGFTLTRRRKEC